MKKILQGFLWVLLMIGSQAYAQTRTVTGTVTSKDDGLPLPGVTVRVDGTSVATQTNGNGGFSLAVPAGGRSLSFAFIGYTPLTANIGSNNVVNVSMGASAQQLNEVVVGAAGLTATRKSIGYSATTIKSDVITQAKPTNLAAALVGKAPGLLVSGTTGGANPNFRIVLRGQRSLTGNNEALIVLDNVIVPNAIFGNLNPEDVQDVQILQGAAAAALYGSDASNGAIIVTTKKGTKGKMQITAQQTLTVEQVAFFPKLQKKFGGGSDNDIQVYLPFENQQYGPAFDGSTVELGVPFADGSVQTTDYTYKNDKYEFWKNGLNNQTDLSLSSGGDKGTIFISGQYVRTTGTLPKDVYNRANIRLNGTHNFTKDLSATYAVNYLQNRNNSSNTSAGDIYDQLLNAPSQAPLNSYKDWQNNPYADPSGYYNAYYNNPYFTIDNSRNITRNDYLTGNLEFRYNPAKWVGLTFRTGIQSRNYSNQTYQDIYRFSDYIKAQSVTAGTYKRSDITGNEGENFLYNTRVTNELQAAFNHKISDFSFKFVAGAFLRQDKEERLSASVTGLVQPGLFNLGNSTNPPTATNADYLARQQALYGVLNVSYKNYLFLNATARNDWFSTLSPANRSFFYPSVNGSFVPTDAIPALKNITQIDYIKFRAGYSKVGNVNLTGILGAYALQPTFNQGSGYPYNGLGGLTVGDRTVSNNLTPEFTYTFDSGVDVALYKERVVATVNYYHNTSKSQTFAAQIANSTGYTSYLLNAGQTSGYGIESTLTLVPVRTKDWQVNVGGNFTYSQNKVDFLVGGIPNVNLSNTTPAGSYGVAGLPLPVIQGRAYVRDDQGRIIVNPVTGYPSATSGITPLGSASPTKVLALNFNATWKNFTLSGIGEYRAGYNIYMGAGTGLDFNGAGINTVAYDRERFVIPNSSYLNAAGQYVANTNITVRDGGPLYWTIDGPRRGIDENYVVSGNFWKIRELALSYTLPKSLLTRTKFIQSARLSVQGRNLFIFVPKTNVYSDPEYSSSTENSGNGIGLSALTNPPSRFYGATLSLTF